MTIPIGLEGTDDSIDARNNQRAAFGTPVPVRVMFDENERIPPEFAAWLTVPIGTVGNPTRVVGRINTRYKCKMSVLIPTGGATLYIANNFAPLSLPNPIGYSLTYAAGQFNLPEYDGMQPVYMVASAAGVVVSVLDESYGAVTNG